MDKQAGRLEPTSLNPQQSV